MQTSRGTRMLFLQAQQAGGDVEWFFSDPNPPGNGKMLPDPPCLQSGARERRQLAFSMMSKIVLFFPQLFTQAAASTHGDRQ